MMRKLREVSIAVLVPIFAWGGSQQPPFQEENWQTNENFRVIYLQADETNKLLDGWTSGQTSMFDDLVVPLTTTRQGALSKPDFDYTNIGYLFPQNDTAEILYFIAQLPHSYKLESTIYPHVHWQQAANQNVTWKLAYKWFDIGDAVPVSFSTVTINSLAITYASGSIHQMSYAPGGIAGTGMGISSILLCKLFRDDNVYTGDALAFQFDFHVELDTLGSASEYTK